MPTWEAEKRPRTRVEDFDGSVEAWKKLVGKEIRIRWPDNWGDAFYTGFLIELSTGVIETVESVFLGILGDEGSWGLIIPLDLDTLDVWVLE